MEQQFSSMKKSLDCPNCGGTNPVRLSEVEYKCAFCDSVFLVQTTVKQEKQPQRESAAHMAMHQAHVNAGKMRRTILLVVVSFMLLVIGFSVYMAMKWNNTMENEMQKSMDEIQKTIKESVPSGS